MLEGVSAAHIVPADLRGYLGRFVFEEAVQVGNLVVDEDSGADAFNAGGLDFVVEGLLAEVVVLLGLVYGEVVLFDVALEKAAAVPLLLVHEHRPSDPLAIYLLLAHV